MINQDVPPLRPLTPKRVRRRVEQINEIDDKRKRARALRHLRRKVLKQIGDGTARKPRACARAVIEQIEQFDTGPEA